MRRCFHSSTCHVDGLVHATASSQRFVKDRLEKEPLQELQVRISYLEIYKECSKELHRKKTLMAKTVGNKSFLPDPNRKEQVTDLFAALNSRHTKVGSSVVAKDTDGVLSDVQTSSMNSQGESLKIMEA